MSMILAKFEAEQKEKKEKQEKKRRELREQQERYHARFLRNWGKPAEQQDKGLMSLMSPLEKRNVEKEFELNYKSRQTVNIGMMYDGIRKNLETRLYYCYPFGGRTLYGHFPGYLKETNAIPIDMTKQLNVHRTTLESLHANLDQFGLASRHQTDERYVFEESYVFNHIFPLTKQDYMQIVKSYLEGKKNSLEHLRSNIDKFEQQCKLSFEEYLVSPDPEIAGHLHQMRNCDPYRKNYNRALQSARSVTRSSVANSLMSRSAADSAADSVARSVADEHVYLNWLKEQEKKKNHCEQMYPTRKEEIDPFEEMYQSLLDVTIEAVPMTQKPLNILNSVLTRLLAFIDSV